MAVIRVLYDGWPLAHAPMSAAAWHLRTLLALSPANIENLLAVPDALAEQELLEGVRVIEVGEKDRGRWEQRTLPELANRESAACIHTTGAAASLLGKLPTLVSPGESTYENERGRMASAQGRGGLARARILWPDDGGAAQLPGNVIAMPVAVHPAFQQPAALASGLDLPEEYLLYFGSGHPDVMMKLLESWTWAAASIGELYPVILVGLSAQSKTFIQDKLPDFHLEDYVRVLDAKPGDLPALLQHCAAVIHPETPAHWGNPIRHALACGKAVVAHQDALTESIVGSAAYLVPAEDLRSFGAATITVVVDEKVREALEAQAKQKSARWKADAFQTRLSEIYASLG